MIDPKSLNTVMRSLSLVLRCKLPTNIRQLVVGPPARLGAFEAGKDDDDDDEDDDDELMVVCCCDGWRLWLMNGDGARSTRERENRRR